MMFWVEEYSGMEHARLLHYLNSLEPAFPELQTRHLENGFWWFVQVGEGEVVAFAGLVPMTPFDGVGYLKRAYVLPAYRGKGLQDRLIHRRERKARELGWTKLVTECDSANLHSQRNLELAGYSRCNPEQPWGKPGDVYFEKRLA